MPWRCTGADQVSLEQIMLLLWIALWAGSAIGYLAGTSYSDEGWTALGWLPATLAAIVAFFLITIVRLPYLLAAELYDRIRDRFR